MGNEVSTPAAPPVVRAVSDNSAAVSRLVEALRAGGCVSFPGVLDSLASPLGGKAVIELVRPNAAGGEDVLGFACYEICAVAVPGVRARSTTPVRVMRLHALEVLPSQRGRGHSRSLLDAVRRSAADAGVVTIWAVAPPEDGLEFARTHVMGGSRAFASWFVLSSDEQVGGAGEAQDCGSAHASCSTGSDGVHSLTAPAVQACPAFPYAWTPDAEDAHAAVARALGASAEGAARDGGIAHHAASDNWDLRRLASAYAAYLTTALGYEDLHAQALSLMAVDDVCGVTGSGQAGEEEEEEEGEEEERGAGEQQAEAGESVTPVVPPPPQPASLLGKTQRVEEGEGGGDAEHTVPVDAQLLPLHAVEAEGSGEGLHAAKRTRVTVGGHEVHAPEGSPGEA